MSRLDQVTALARAAVLLLPEPPAIDDILGYLAWRELVWDTAGRLGRIAEGELPATGHLSQGFDNSEPMTAFGLLELAAVAAVGGVHTAGVVGFWEGRLPLW